MKLMGVIFVVTSAGAMGVGISRSLHRRCVLLRQLLQALQLMRNEIAFCGTPLPKVFALMAVACEGPLEQIFSETAKRMDRQHWLTPQQAIKDALSEEKDAFYAPVLLELTFQLGKYDLTAQISAVETARSRTEEMLLKLEQEKSKKSGTYEMLGVCAGIAVAILLI